MTPDFAALRLLYVAALAVMRDYKIRLDHDCYVSYVIIPAKVNS